MTQISKPEVMKLITIASMIDGRQASAELVDLWHTLLSGNTYQEALDGLMAHMKESPYPAQPAHINEKVKRARFRHQELYGVQPPPGKKWAVDAIENDTKYGEVEL